MERIVVALGVIENVADPEQVVRPSVAVPLMLTL